MTGSWSFRICYDDTGLVTSMNGARCGVVLWANSCNVEWVSECPGTDGTHLIDDGAGWWIRLDVDREGRVIRTWGESIGGGYYVIVSEDDVADYY